MGGHGCTVQIDESLFQGKRKYDYDRLKCGYHQPLRNINNSNEANSGEKETVKT